MTQEQDVVAAKNRIAHLKGEYLAALTKAVNPDAPRLADYRDVVLECQQRGNAYFNCAEEFVGNSDLLGAHRSGLWAQGFAEDCAEILRSLPAHVQFLKAAFAHLPGLDAKSAVPGPTAFANMQRMVVAYLGPAISKQLEKQFIADGLPIYGFKNAAGHPMSKALSTILAFVFGVVFVTALLAIAWNKPDPSEFQYTVFRAVLAIAVAGVAAVIPGFIEVKISNWVVAGGALAVFIVIYFWNPAMRNQDRQDSGSSISETSRYVAFSTLQSAPAATGIRLHRMGTI